MKKAVLCRVKSQQGKIYAAQIGFNDKKQPPVTQILIEIPTSDFDYRPIQIDDDVRKGNVKVELEGYMFTSDEDEPTSREAKSKMLDEYITGLNSIQ